MNMVLYEWKYEKFISFDMKLSDITSNKPSSYYEQPYSDLIKWPLIKSPRKSSHES